MVYGVTRQSGGHVTCHSDPGVGTRFRVYLPASGDAPAPNYLSQKLRPEAFRGTETILLAEDDPVVRTYAARLLRGLGYSIHEAADGEAAIVLGEKNRETIDLLITDMVMPGMGGRELAAVLRPLSSRMRVLYVSGYTDEAIVGNSMGSAFLPKPYSPQQLARKVREVLRA
jgi:two-component system, cell cycle sensor histidine kinase and response regulator CckA